MARHRSSPDWFTVQFDRPSEWATLRIPDEHFVEWQEGAVRLFTETSLWDGLVRIQFTLVEKIKERDWTAVSPWHLVLHLKLVHDIKSGMANFLPTHCRTWPVEIQQACFFAHCLMKGHAMIEEDHGEDFGLPELARLPATVRPILAAVKPLWHVLAEPAIRAAIQFHRSQHEQGFDAGLVKLLTELDERPDAASVLALLETTPGAIVKRIRERGELHAADHHYLSHEPEGNVLSEAFFHLNEFLKRDSAATALARAMLGDLDGWTKTVRRNVQAAKQDLVVEFEDTPTWVVSGGFPDAEATQNREDLERAYASTDRLTKILRDDVTLPAHLRRLLTLLLKDPLQTNVTLGKHLGKSSATIGTWKRELAAKYHHLHP